MNYKKCLIMLMLGISSARLTALTADNKDVKITLSREAEKVTQIGVRVGTFGDESLSRLILDKIRERY